MPSKERITRRAFIAGTLGCFASGACRQRRERKILSPTLTKEPTRIPTLTPISTRTAKPTESPPTPTPEPMITPPTIDFSLSVSPEQKVQIQNSYSFVLTSPASIVTVEENLRDISIINEQDEYYPWYQVNGGKILFDPLNIPAGTKLYLPTPETPLFPLAEVEQSPEKWNNVFASNETNLAGSSETRLFNITLATERLNNTVIKPHHLFSILQTIGPLTLENGYKIGRGYTNEGEVPMEAGGACQVPSTLFKSLLEAGLLVVERTQHMYYSDRYDIWDATIADDAYDLTCRNLFNFPVQIRANIDREQMTLNTSVVSPFENPYETIEVRELYKNKQGREVIDGAVQQIVVYEGQRRERIYYSQYQPKPQ